MRKKVRKSLAFLLALALVVSVMSGLGLSVSADDAQNEPVVTETEGEPAEEKPKVEESTPKEGEEEEEADPDAEAVPEEKKDVKKAEGEGSGEKAAENKAAETPKAGENVQTATIGTGDKTVTVKTTAAAGVLPEGAKLTVKKLASIEADYREAEKTLGNNNVSYDGMLALDVGFVVNGQEVEPESGSVQVQFELGAGLLPEDADPDSLAVMHLTDGKVKESTEDVAVSGDTVKAELEVKSFSTFTVLWDGFFSDGYMTVTVHYVDEDGQEIFDVNTSDKKIGINGRLTFADTNVAKQVTDYTYQSAHYGTYDGSLVTKVEGDYSNLSRKFIFYNGTREVKRITEGYAADVYLVYKYTGSGSGGSGGSITPAPEPAHTKKAVKNKDGTYDLSLSVKGTAGSETQPAAVDILMIVDVSGSMKGDRIENLKTAMNKLVSTVKGNSDIDARVSIVSFSHIAGAAEADATVKLGWTSIGSTAVTSSISGLSASGGTNYQAGLRRGKVQLNSARTNAQKIVIFLSDGEPTYYIGGGNGSSTIGSTGWNETQAEAAGMSCDQFYSIGISSSQATYLRGVMNKVHATKKEYKESNSDGSNLTSIFEGIAGQVTEIHCTQVEVHDTLSGMAQMTTISNGTVKQPVVTVTDKNGQTVLTPDGITASYDESTRTISMNFPSYYELNPNYTYTVTATIEPSEAAYEAYYENGGSYPNTPDAGTGTHADENESGFYCNTSATLTYNNGTEKKTVSYGKPVIQVEPKVNDLTITKVVTDDNQEGNPDVFNITYSFTITPGTGVTVNDGTYGDATFSNNTGTVTISGAGTASVTKLPVGSYTVTETTPTTDPVGYEFDSTGSTLTGSATLTKDAAGSVTITNNYKLKQLKVTILKDVTGNMGETNREFSFTAGDDSFRLKDKDENTSSKKVITVPYGSNLSITESDYSGDGYTTTYQVGSENAQSGSTCRLTNITEDTTVTFINEKNVNPPTGVTTNVTPYIIMAVLAAGAAVFFVMNRRPQGKRYS